jgi:hypothetical protein
MFNDAKAVGKKAEVEMGRSRGCFWESGSLKSPAKGNLGKKAEVELTLPAQNVSLSELF